MSSDIIPQTAIQATRWHRSDLTHHVHTLTLPGYSGGCLTHDCTGWRHWPDTQPQDLDYWPRMHVWVPRYDVSLPAPAIEGEALDRLREYEGRAFGTCLWRLA